jgi:hypothetical protein
MNHPKESAIGMSFKEMFEGAEETTFFEEVAESIRTEENAEAFESAMAQRDQEWSLLANQVVGHEQL